MAAENQPKLPVLEGAWTRFAQLDAASENQQHTYFRLRRWVYILGVVATFLAVMTQVYPPAWPALGSLAIKILLILTPLVISVLAAYTSKFYTGGDWLILRAGAEEMLKEIYTFRTILKNSPDRRKYLEERLAAIQRKIYRASGGELALDDIPDKIPPYYDPKDPLTDAGFHDLTGEQYFKCRVANQAVWHMNRINKFQKRRRQLQVFILLTGLAGAFLAAAAYLDTTISLWVALTSSLAAALIGWQELSNLDATVKNYNKVVVELNIIIDHWNGMEPEERTDAEFFKMVQATEDLLWAQNVEYIKSMQEAMSKEDLEEQAAPIYEALRKAKEADARLKASMRKSLEEAVSKGIEAGETAAADTFQATLGTLAEEASSDIVQQELAAMGQAVTTAAEALLARGSKFRHSLDEIAAEYAHVKVGKETPTKVLNEMISRFPPTNEVKG